MATQPIKSEDPEQKDSTEEVHFMFDKWIMKTSAAKRRKRLQRAEQCERSTTRSMGKELGSICEEQNSQLHEPRKLEIREKTCAKRTWEESNEDNGSIQSEG